ncbi:MAG: hypothetical protein OEP52_06845 [Acidimicrobiia bacterium]|nr:hypothetical protein [Acidimicrobiia bacterium]
MSMSERMEQPATDGRPENDLADRSTTFTAGSLLPMAWVLKNAGCGFDIVNPECR